MYLVPKASEFQENLEEMFLLEIKLFINPVNSVIEEHTSEQHHLLNTYLLTLLFDHKYSIVLATKTCFHAIYRMYLMFLCHIWNVFNVFMPYMECI